MAKKAETKERLKTTEMGRPSSYNEEVIAKAQYYLENYEELESAVPSIAGLSLFLEIPRSTMYVWAGQEDKKDFLDMLQKIKSKQEEILITKGLKNEYNSSIVKLMLAKHGYHEKAEMDITSNGKSVESRHLTVEQKQVFDKFAEEVKKLEGVE